jgi:hypothetical protein
LNDASVLNALDYLIYDKQRYEEPFARLHRIAETVFDLDVQLRGIEDAMNQVFQLHAVDVVKNVSGDNLHVGQQESGIKTRVSETRSNLSSGHTDFMQNLTIGCNYRIVRLASQNVNGPAGEVVCVLFLCEQRPSVGVGNDAACIFFIGIKRVLERSRQRIALGSIVVDNPQSAVPALIPCLESLSNLGDIRDLAADNEELSRLYLSQLDFVHSVHRKSLANPRFQLSLYALEERFERIEILADGTIGDFLCARFSALARTWRSSVMPLSPSAPASSAISSSSSIASVGATAVFAPESNP